MSSLWHPLSAVLAENPRCFAAPRMLQLLLKGGPVQLLYAGDRMWPALTDGARVTAHSIEFSSLSPGDIVLAVVDGIVDLLRVEQIDATGARLSADSDCTTNVRVDAVSIIAKADPAPERRGSARLHRLRLDLTEASRCRADRPTDPAIGVLDKYDFQAPYYAAVSGSAISEGLAGRIRRLHPRPGRALVAGSGVGRECFELEEAGWTVDGLDFAPAMVRESRRRADKRGSTCRFFEADLRDPPVDENRYDLVFFTYDVYSFVPTADERLAVLRALDKALRPEGAILLSARVVRGLYARVLLWLARLARGGGEWGASHTRWIDASGTMRRSFVKLFTLRALTRETRRAGFRVGPFRDGYAELTRRRSDLP